MSFVSAHTRGSARASYRPPATVIALTGLLTLIAAGAIQGGISMVTDTIHPMGISLQHLEATPFDDYLWPGMFLLGIALASMLTIPGLLLKWEWRWAWRIERAFGFEWPWISIMSIAVLLYSFEVIGLLFAQLPFVMHLLLVGVSLNMIGLALTDSARRYLAS